MRLRAAALYLALGWFLTFPSGRLVTTGFLTDHFDAFGHLWRAWRMGSTGLLSLRWAADTDLLFHPFGSNIPEGSGLAALHGLTCTLWLWLVNHVLSAPLAWNLTMVLTVALSAMAARELVLHLTGRTDVALLGGLFLVLADGYLEELYEGVLEQAALFPALLCLLCLLRLRRSPSSPPLWAAAGALFVLTGLTSLYHLFALGCVFLAGLPGWRLRLGAFLVLALGMGLFLDTAAPLSRPAAEAVLRAPADTLDSTQEAARLVLQDSFPPALLLDRCSVRPLASHYLTYLQFLAALGVVLSFRRSLPWLVAAAVFFSLAMGPWVLSADSRILGPSPAWPLHALAPFLGALRPVRFLAAVHVCLVVLACFGVSEVLRRATLPPRAVLAGVTALALADFFLIPPALYPCSVVSARVPEFYRRLAVEGPGPALLEWPLYPVEGFLTGTFLQWQTVHGRPLVNCGFLRPATSRALDRWTGTNRLMDFLVKGFHDLDRAQPVRGEDVEALARQGIGYVVLHEEVPAGPFRLLPEEAEGALFSTRLVDGLRQVLGEPSRPGDGCLVFRVSPAPSLGAFPRDDRYRQAVDRAAVLFPPSYSETTASLDLGEGGARAAFWIRSSGGDCPLTVGRTSFVARGDTWSRVEVPLGTETLALVRPPRGEFDRIHLFRVEVMSP